MRLRSFLGGLLESPPMAGFLSRCVALLAATAASACPPPPPAVPARTPLQIPAVLEPGSELACTVTCRAACDHLKVRGKTACDARCEAELRRPERAEVKTRICGSQDVSRVRVVAALIRRTLFEDAIRTLDEIYDLSVQYFENHRRFPPPGGPIPARLCASPDGLNHVRPQDWATGPWKALGFSLAAPFYFRLTYESEGEGAGARFRVRAEGDLDCDGVTSLFEAGGSVDPNGTVVANPRPRRVRDE
jgi:hypothetical protein